MRHPHAELIRKALNAAVMDLIPVRASPETYLLIDAALAALNESKPQTVTKWLWASRKGQLLGDRFLTESQAVQCLGDCIKLEWSKHEFEVQS